MKSASTRGAAVAAALLFAWATSASAQAPRPALVLACGQDYQRVCQGVGPDERPILSCLSSNFDRLGAGCKAHLLLRAALEACESDLRAYCQGVIPGAGRGLTCLLSNKDRLTRACLKTLEAGGREIERGL